MRNPYAGAAAIRRRYRELADRDGSIPEIAARVGRDPMVDEVWHQACAALGLALVTYTLIQDPELIVLRRRAGERRCRPAQRGRCRAPRPVGLAPAATRGHRYRGHARPARCRPARLVSALTRMFEPYVHGYHAEESLRLEDQASTLVELLHGNTSYPPGCRVLEAGCGVGAQTVCSGRP